MKRRFKSIECASSLLCMRATSREACGSFKSPCGSGAASKILAVAGGGTAIGKSCYKIRVPIASKGKGKSGGASVITNLVVTDQTVYLLSIYDKADKENLTNKELEELLNYIPL